MQTNTEIRMFCLRAAIDSYGDSINQAKNSGVIETAELFYKWVKKQQKEE